MKQYTLIREVVAFDVINDRHVGRLDAVGIDAAGVVHKVTVPFRPDDPRQRALALKSMLRMPLRLVPFGSKELNIAKKAPHA